MEVAKENEHARVIIEELDKRKGLSFEEKIEEAYEYLKHHNELPSLSNGKIIFSDGASMANWLSQNKNRLLEIAEDNEHARVIIDELDKRKGLSFEERIEEAYGYLKTNGELPTHSDKEIKFSDGIFIGRWLRNNKQKLLEVAKENEHARVIIDELNVKKDLIFERRIEEVYEYLKTNGELPSRNNKKTIFSDGTYIGYWLDRNKQRILEVAKENEHARVIIEELNKRKGLSFEEKIDEAYEYLKHHNELPALSNMKIIFSDGVSMAKWLGINKNRLLEIAEDNEHARVIIDELDKRKGLSFEEKIEEAYGYLKTNGELPSRNNKKTIFSDGVSIANWLNQNKNRLLEIAEDNKHARVIIDELDKRKGLSFEEKIEETYKYFKQSGTIPTMKDKQVKFSDGTFIGSWVYRQRLKLIESYNLDENIKMLVDLILEIKPNFFDNVLQTLKAKEEFGTVSKFEEVKQRIAETKTKGKEDEGRKIQ